MADDIGDGQIGGECSLYVNSGDYDTPTWELYSNIGDLDHPDSRDAVEIPIRAQYPDVGSLPGLRKIGASWTTARTKGAVDEITATVLAAYIAGTPLDLAFTDGPIATVGTKVKRRTMIITKKDESEPIGDTAVISFEAALAFNNGGHGPSDYTVS